MGLFPFINFVESFPNKGLKMAAIDKLYDKDGKVVIRLDAYSNEDLKYFKDQIDMYLGEDEEDD